MKMVMLIILIETSSGGGANVEGGLKYVERWFWRKYLYPYPTKRFSLPKYLEHKVDKNIDFLGKRVYVKINSKKIYLSIILVLFILFRCSLYLAVFASTELEEVFENYVLLKVNNIISSGGSVYFIQPENLKLIKSGNIILSCVVWPWMIPHFLIYWSYYIIHRNRVSEENFSFSIVLLNEKSTDQIWVSERVPIMAVVYRVI